MCRETVGLLLHICLYMTQKRARGRLRALSATLRASEGNEITSQLLGACTVTGTVEGQDSESSLGVDGSRHKVCSFLDGLPGHHQVHIVHICIVLYTECFCM